MPRRPAARLAPAAARAVGALTAAAVFLAPAAAHAGGAGGGGLAWEAPLQLVANSLTGPVAAVISLMAISVSGGMLIWGGELNEFARRMIMVVLVIALIVFAASFLSSLFGIGAVLPAASGAGHGLALAASAASVALGAWLLDGARRDRRRARA